MASSPLPLTLVDWLDDLCVRFLLNLPSSELSSVPRLCFQVEEAQWYYEDFVRPAVAATPGAAPLPSLSLRQFCLLLFQHCPLLSGFTDAQHIAAYEEFLAYKVRVPVRGAILMDEDMSKVVLVRGWKKGSSWSFPRGKINKDERDLDCAIREVYEETGYDISTSGLLPENYNYEDEVGEESKIKYIDITMREQHMRLFVFRGVPLDTVFETKTRKEISKIAWYDIKDLPGFAKHKNHKNQHHHAAQHPHPQQSEAEGSKESKFYMVAPFLGSLKKWINIQRKKDVLEAQKRKTRDSLEFTTATEDDTEDQIPVHEETVDLSKEEALKKLLSIGGGPSPAPVPNTSAPSAMKPNASAGNLLAMLQGSSSNGGQLPHTPFDQMNAFPPQQPASPQPQHFRQPSAGHFQPHPQGPPGPPPPHFPFSPQGFPPVQQRNTPAQTPNVFGQPQFPPNQPPPFPQPGMGLPPHLQQQPFPPRPNVQGPPYLSAPYPSGPQNNFPFQPQPPMRPPSQIPPPLFQGAPPQNAPFLATQGPGAIASGPSVPNASQLPPPRLNAHAARLLDAFKGGPPDHNNNNNLTPPPANQSTHAPRPSSTHQNALLDLFKKPSAPAAHVEPDAELDASMPAEAPLSPALTDVTEKPPRPRMEERRPTLNEITRTLGPIKVKSKKVSTSQSVEQISAPAEPPAEPAGATGQVQPVVQEVKREKQLFDPYEGVMKPVTPITRDAREDAGVVRERPKSRQLFDPNDSNATKSALGNTKPEGQDSSSPVRKILQRPTSKQGSRSPKLNRQTLVPGSSSSPARDSPAVAAPTHSNFVGSRPSSFTILTRPGSSWGTQKSPGLPVTPTSPAARSEVRNEQTPKPAFQPQLLKRPKDGDAPAPASTREGDEAKREQLLALFGKTSAGAPALRTQQAEVELPADTSVVRPARDEPQAAGQVSNKNANALLNLFNSDGGSSTLQPARSPDPPRAPKLSPSARKVSPMAPPATSPPLQPSPPTAAGLTPFQPANVAPKNDHRNLLLDLFHKPASSSSNTTLPTANILNSPNTPISPFTLGTPATNLPGASFSSVGSRLASAGGSSPVDEGKDKEFLMGYLNGVVKGEGYKGAGWGV